MKKLPDMPDEGPSELLDELADDLTDMEHKFQMAAKRSTLKSQQIEAIAQIGEVYISPNEKWFRVDEIAKLLVAGIVGGDSGPLHKNKKADRRAMLALYQQQIRLAVELHEIKLLSPATMAPETRDLDWLMVQDHFVIRPQLEEFALRRFGIEIIDGIDLTKSLTKFDPFDPNSEFYPPELHLAFKMWSALTQVGTPDPEEKATDLIVDWLKVNDPKVSGGKITRLKTVCNWHKKPGPPKKN